MVAYSFQPMFVAPILKGTKRQTIRAVGLKRHADEGDEMQLYTGMRTKRCKLIGTSQCIGAEPITLTFEPSPKVWTPRKGEIRSASALDRFAVSDGFGDWDELVAFWRKHHTRVIQDKFFKDGRIMYWGRLR